MSRILKKKIEVPSGVSISYTNGRLNVSCGKNSVNFCFPLQLQVGSDNHIDFSSMKSFIDNDDMLTTYYVLVRNAISDVVKPYVVSVKLVGVGYNIGVVGKFLRLFVGYSHNIFFAIPNGVSVSVKNDTEIEFSGSDRCVVKSFANLIRSVRKPEPYKGKGIFIDNEKVLRKEGKKK